MKDTRARPADPGPCAGMHRPDWIILGLLLTAALVLTLPTALVPDIVTVDPTGCQDLFIFAWNSWWVGQAMLDPDQSPFFSPMLYWPDGVDLAYHTLAPLHSVLFIPFQYVWPGPTGYYIAFNSFLILSFFLASAGMYLLARYVSGARLPSVLAAVYYSYSNFRYANTTRVHVISNDLFPFVFLALLIWLATGKKRYGGLTGLLLMLVVYTSTEYAAYLALLLPIFTVVWIWRRPGEVRLRRVVRPGSLACFLLPIVVGMSIILPPVIAQRGANAHFTKYGPPDRFIANVVDLLLPNAHHPLWGDWAAGVSAQYHYGESTFGLALGWVGMLLVLGYVVAAPGGGKGSRGGAESAEGGEGKWLWVGWGVFCVVLALGPTLQVGHFKGANALFDQMPYKWAWHALPFIRASRRPQRWIALGQMFIAVVIALGAKRLLERFPRRRNAVFAVLLGLMLFEHWGVPFPMATKEIPQLYREIAAHGTKGCVTHMAPPSCCPALLYQIVHGQPVFDLVGFAMPAAVLRAESLPFRETGRSFWMYLLPLRALDSHTANPIRPPPGPMTRRERLDGARRAQEKFSIVYVVVPKGEKRLGEVGVGYDQAREFLEALGPTRMFDDENDTLFIYDQYAVDGRARP